MPLLPHQPSTLQATGLVSTPAAVRAVLKQSIGQMPGSIDEVSHPIQALELAGAEAETGAGGSAAAEQVGNVPRVSITIPSSSGVAASERTALQVSVNGVRVEQPSPAPVESPSMSPPPPPPRLTTARRSSSCRTVGGPIESTKARSGRRDASTNFPSVKAGGRRTRGDGGGGVLRLPTTGRSSTTSKRNSASLERDKDVAEAPRSGSADELRKGSMGSQASGDRGAGDCLPAATTAVKATRK